jgi:hypothetical protein
VPAPRTHLDALGLASLKQLDPLALEEHLQPPPPVPPPPPPLDLPPAERLAVVRERSQRAREAAAEQRSQHTRAREARRAASAAAEAPPAPGFVKGRFAAISTTALIERRARELFEEVAMAGVQRTPLLGDEWRAADAIDRRMLRAVDAIAGLGARAVSSLEGLVVDAPAKDASRGFALAFVLGCIEGRDGLAAVERALRHLDPADAEVRERVGGALALAVHPDLDRLLRTWLEDEDPFVRAVAVEVLGYRRGLTEREIEALLEDASLDVVAAAVRWAALGRASSLAPLRGVVVSHASTEHAALEDAIVWALAVGGLAGGPEELAGCIGTRREQRALMPLALVADAAEARRLVDTVRAEPTEAGVVALGFLGAAGGLPVLVGVLEDREAPGPLKLAAAFALQRITGFEPFDDVDIPPEKLEAEEPADPKAIPKEHAALARIIGDPRDAPSDGSPDRMKLPSTRPEVWKEYLRREAVRYEGGGRFRRGRPYTPALSLEELSTYAVTPVERRWLYREIIVKTGEVVPFDPHDFVAVQEEAIERMAPVAQRASSRPGAWGRASRR